LSGSDCRQASGFGSSPSSSQGIEPPVLAHKVVSRSRSGSPSRTFRTREDLAGVTYLAGERLAERG
jgi:hypothetical protein